MPEGAAENEGVKPSRDITIQCDNVMEARKADIFVADRKGQKGMIIDIAVPADARVGEKKQKRQRSIRN